MLQELKRKVKSLFLTEETEIRVRWIRHSEISWLAQQYPEELIEPEPDTLGEKIERITVATNQIGPQPLWDGYPPQDRGPTRYANHVGTPRIMGSFYTDLVKKRRPRVIVEFGTAFGVSGMYWCAGLEANQDGELLTFEPNKTWADIANMNLSQISKRFTLVVGTFEENIDEYLVDDQKIDVGFIDAIHTREFVIPQLNLVLERSSPRALIILDDINFSQDMRECWEEVSASSRFCASAALGNRVGILELGD